MAGGVDARPSFVPDELLLCGGEDDSSWELDDGDDLDLADDVSECIE